MEAALRTAYELVTGEKLGQLDFKNVRGEAGIKEAEVTLNGTQLKVAVAHGLGNVRKLMELIKSGKEYHFVELMACPGGMYWWWWSTYSHQ